MQQSITMRLAHPHTSVLGTLYVRMREYGVAQDGELVLIITTYRGNQEQHDEGSLVQKVERRLSEFGNLASYVVSQYGGYIVPVPHKRMFRTGTPLDEVLLLAEDYAEDLRANEHCGRDSKVYCFLMEQPMMLPRVEYYARVLSSASNMSKKYLNTIFTRKQQPAHKSAYQLIDNYERLRQKYTCLEAVKKVAECSMEEIRELEQVLGILTQLSGQVNPCMCPQGHLVLQVQRVTRTAEKYMRQSMEAFERWDILVERVRELQNNLLKGMHEDEHKYQEASKQLSKWTLSLNTDMRSMGECFDQFVDYLCVAVTTMRTETIEQILKEPQEAMVVLERKNEETIETSEGLEWVQTADKEGSQETVDQIVDKR